MIKLKIKQNKLGTSGFSLIEVMASIIILFFILLSFFTLLISSAKTINTSETIVNYTYLAQKEMENVYEKSSSSTLNKWEEIKNTIPSLGYANIGEDADYTIFKKTIADKKAYILLKIKMHKPYEYNNLTNIIIEVYDEEKDILKSQMESIVSWGGL